MQIKSLKYAAGLAVAVCSVFAAGPAQAAITVDSRSSISDAYGVVDSPQFFDFDEDSDTRTSSDTSAPFTYNASALAEAFGGEAEANAEHSSTLTFTGGSLSGVDVSGYVDVSVLASTGVTAQAEALSRLLLLFTVPAGETAAYSLAANLEDFSNKTTLELYLYDVERDTDLVLHTGNAGVINAAGTLQPGQYEFSATAFGLGSEVNQSFGDAQFNADLTLVSSAIPEPAALALLVLPAALLARRGRRRV